MEALECGRAYFTKDHLNLQKYVCKISNENYKLAILTTLVIKC